MGAQHHQSAAEIEAQRRMLQEFLGNAKPRFPNGRLNEADEGELSFAVTHDPIKRVVVLRYSKAVDWIGLDKYSCQRLINILQEHCNEL